MDFSPLSVNFILDDEMKNYQEIFDWMVKLYFPDNFDQYKTLVDVKPGGFGLISDLTLSVLTAGSNKNKSIVFYDAFPISIGELQFNYQNSDVEYVTCSVQFQFKSFDFVE